MMELIGQVVEVSANDIIYSGILVEIGESDVYLETGSGWIVIPVDRIAFIRKKG